MERIIHMRYDCPEFGRGNYEVLDTGDPRLFAHLCREDDHFALAVHNLSGEEVTVKLDLLQEDANHLLDLFGDCKYEDWDAKTQQIRLRPYGYRWFRRTQFESG